MRQWFLENSDKLMLLGLVLLFAFSAIHGSPYSQRVSDMVLGSLLTVITGKAINKIGGPDDPTPPPVPSATVVPNPSSAPHFSIPPAKS